MENNQVTPGDVYEMVKAPEVGDLRGREVLEAGGRVRILHVTDGGDMDTVELGIIDNKGKLITGNPVTSTIGTSVHNLTERYRKVVV